jgi:integrase
MVSGSMGRGSRLTAAGRGLSQAALAGLVGRSESWLSQVERGVRSVDRLSILVDMAKVLHVEVDALTGRPWQYAPERWKHAGSEPTPERPAATVDQVLNLAEHVPARFRALILLAAFTGLRYGELAALRRRYFDPKCTAVTVVATVIEPKDGALRFGPPKSTAGRRTVTIPAAIRQEIKKHLDTFVAADPDALVFTSSRGAVLRRSNFQRATRWTTTVKAAGLPGFHLHDLRHTGYSLAAASGDSLRSLMTRMGHDSMRAALIYQHTGQRDDAAIAAALSKQIQRHRARSGHAGKNRKKK